ncbi:uncharacterized protein BN609_01370 [Staphylococcus sp. CAG:324]|jgi:hypothetical protein|nr:uncharacterized protein BN609_01370 [Staphylococcus sp. CAG:324]
MPTITDWLMVIITLVYVVATVFICIANIKSAKAAREQTEEMKKQFSLINRPSVSAEIVYLKRTFWMLRFNNNGNQVSYNTKIILDEDFINSVEDDYRGPLDELKNKVCTIGVNQHYDIFIGTNEYRDLPNKKNIKGTIISYDISGKEFSDNFEIEIENYVTFYSTTSESEDLIKEIKNQNEHLKKISSKLK